MLVLLYCVRRFTQYLIVSISVCLYLFFFFFSSRRRHTRLVSDWSSDVCSSDLRTPSDSAGQHRWVHSPKLRSVSTTRARSEERRVGKECRSRWSADH